MAPPVNPDRRAWFWAGVALLLVADLWLRGHAFGPALRDRLGFAPYLATSRESEPLDCDEGIYGYIGHRLAHGAVMYRDLTENKPPGGYWVYAAAVALGGATELTVRLLPLPFTLATLALVALTARRLAGPAAGLVAAAVYAVASTDPFLYGESANMEHFINLFSVASLAALVLGGRPGRLRVAAAGAALAAACLVKQTALINLPLYVLGLLAWPRTEGVGPSRRTEAAALAVGFGVPLVVAAAVLVAQGAGSAAFDDIFRYGRALAAETPAPPGAPPFLVRWVTGNADPQGGLPWPFGVSTYLVWWGTGTWPVWLAAVPALGWLAAGPGADARRRLVAAWTLAAWVQVAAPRLFWQHYYLLPVPGLAVVVAVFARDLAGLAWRGPVVRRGLAGVASLALSAALAWAVVLHVREYLLVPPEQLVQDRGGPQWLRDRALGRELGRRSTLWERPTLFVWGWQGSLHLYSGLDGVTRQVFVDDFLRSQAGGNHPLVRPRLERTIRELRERPPAVVFASYPPFPALKSYLEERYYPSRLPGVWVDREHYGAFEAFPAATATPGAAPATTPR